MTSLAKARHHPRGIRQRIYLLPPRRLAQAQLFACSRASPRHPIMSLSPKAGTGILTCFPSTTPFSLALGSD